VFSGVYNRKKTGRGVALPPRAGNVPEPAPVSWEVALWRTPGSRRADSEPALPSQQSKLALFEETILPHLDAAHNLARWLTRSDVDAQDLVQESYLRAFRFFDTYRGGDSKAWILTIVRNTCRTWLRRQIRDAEAVPFDEAAHSGAVSVPDQEQGTFGRERMEVLRGCIEMLAVDFREILILRELEEMSYQEIAQVTGLALGTVMSRLSRARKRLAECAAGRNLEAAG
jgi:RNA polymerase sigma-70 factor (ECF subfamily)